MVSSIAFQKFKFNRLLVESVDEGLYCLGELPRKTLYLSLERKFDLRKDEIPFRLDEFIEAIERIFGSSASLVEISIMKRLHTNTKCTIEWCELECFGFSKYVNTVKLAFLFDEKKQKVRTTPTIVSNLETVIDSDEECVE